MAPKPTGGSAAYERRAASSGHTAQAALLWRVGRTGSLRLSLRANEAATGLLAEVQFEAHRDPRLSESFGLTGTATVSIDGGERRISLLLRRETGNVTAEACLLRHGSRAEVLLLTDLPARIGLRGGTYLLDPRSVEPFLEALEAAASRL